MALTYTDPNANVIDLDDGSNFFLEALKGAGMPMLDHRAVQTPARDGETWIDVTLEPRFLIAQLVVQGVDWTAHQVNRMALIAALNPKKGQGVLKYTPDATQYAIDCIVQRGVEFSKPVGGSRQNALVSFRCSDPTWYLPAQNSDTIANTGSGLTVPIDVPISFDDGTGTETIVNAGHVAVYPEITVPGACTNPVITNTTTGKKLQFVNMTVAEGQNLVIDCEARTAKIGSTSYLHLLSADSEFWTLETGNNVVSFGIDTGTVTAIVRHYTRYLGL